jgi:hypothetical protein
VLADLDGELANWEAERIVVEGGTAIGVARSELPGMRDLEPFAFVGDVGVRAIQSNCFAQDTRPNRAPIRANA